MREKKLPPQIIPILMIGFNRKEYTAKALKALRRCEGIEIYFIDNGSTPDEFGNALPFNGTYEIESKVAPMNLIENRTNIGIAGAMNQFLQLTSNSFIVGKVDNDTIVPGNFIEKMLPHMQKADIVQAKHKLIAASKVGTFDEWVSKMPEDGALRYNHFVGGSGILFKRQLVNHIPETESKIMGWRTFQREHPELKKAFALDCEIELLDEHGYEDYPEYYKQTGRV